MKFKLLFRRMTFLYLLSLIIISIGTKTYACGTAVSTPAMGICIDENGEVQASTDGQWSEREHWNQKVRDTKNADGSVTKESCQDTPLTNANGDIITSENEGPAIGTEIDFSQAGDSALVEAKGADYTGTQNNINNMNLDVNTSAENSSTNVSVTDGKGGTNFRVEMKRDKTGKVYKGFTNCQSRTVTAGDASRDGAMGALKEFVKLKPNEKDWTPEEIDRFGNERGFKNTSLSATYGIKTRERALQLLRNIGKQCISQNYTATFNVKCKPEKTKFIPNYKNTKDVPNKSCKESSPGCPAPSCSTSQIGTEFSHTTSHEVINPTWPRYIKYRECPSKDNEGWYFWNELPYGTQLGSIKGIQSSNFKDYMIGNSKGDSSPVNPARLSAYSTYIEQQGFYKGVPAGEATARRLDSDRFVLTGQPTYERWGPLYEVWDGATELTNRRTGEITNQNDYASKFNTFQDKMKEIRAKYKRELTDNGGSAPGTDSMNDSFIRNVDAEYAEYYKEQERLRALNGSLSANSNPDGTHKPGMTMIEHGWYDQAFTSEAADVNARLGNKVFTRTPKGKFEVTWLEPEEGYNQDGTPRWRTGTNITRRCQQSYEALVKHARDVYTTTWVNDIYKKTCLAYSYDPCLTTHNEIEYYDKYNPRTKKFETKERVIEVCEGGCVQDIECSETYSVGPRPDSTSYSYTIPPVYKPARDWNYRDKIDTEFKSYPTPDPNPDPNKPNDPPTDYPDPSNPPTGNDTPPGNTLIPYVGNPGKDGGNDGEKDTGEGTNISNKRPGHYNNRIKSGYGVTYKGNIKLYTDWGRPEDSPAVSVVNRDLGRKLNPDNPRFSFIIRPGKTTNIPIGPGQNFRVGDSADNIDVNEERSVHGIKPSGSSAPDTLYITDGITRTLNGNPVDPMMGNGELTNPDEVDTAGRNVKGPRLPNPGANDVELGKVITHGEVTGNVAGREYRWKQKSGLGIEYGTDIGYYHAFRKTKLNNDLVPGGRKSNQHFIHLDYPNGIYSVGSIIDVQMFAGEDPWGNSGSSKPAVNVGGRMLRPTMRTKMGNYANIEVKGNMYEDTYTAPDNPFLNGRQGGK